MVMHFIGVVLSVFLLFSRLNCHEFSSEFVTELDSTNFDSHVDNSRLTLVILYAPWCGHCKQFLPEFARTCEEVRKNLPSDVECGQLDCTKNEEVCTKQGIRGFPTVQLLKAGFQCEYKGDRTKDALYKWVSGVIDASNVISDIDKVKEIIEVDYTLVAYFEEGHEKLRDVDTLACFLTNAKIAVISDESLAKEIGITEKNTFSLFKDGKYVSTIESGLSPSVLRMHWWFATNPLVPSYSHSKASTVFAEDVKHYMALLYSTEDSFAKYHEILIRLAKDLINKVRVFTVDVSDTSNKNVVDYFSVIDTPKIVFYNDELGDYYHLSQDFSDADDLQDFYKGCVNGTIPKYVKRQPIPEDWDKEPVKVLVVDNFDLAFESYKKGMILFYAPWCGHCKAMKQAWDDFGAKISAKHPEFFVGKVDHTQNEISGIQVTGYPTVLAFKSRHDFVPYKGERTVEAFEEFFEATLIRDETPSQEETEKAEGEKEDEL